MLIDRATRGVFRSRTAAAVAATMILTGSARHGHAATHVYAAFKVSGSIQSESPIVELKVPGGIYAIFAKVNIDQDDTTSWVTVTCTLQAGLEVDRNVSRLQRSSSVDNETIPLQLVVALPAYEVNDIELSCKFDAVESSKLSFRFAKITAIDIDGLRCEKPSPAECIPF
jgi:hypothetical protein